MMTHVFAVYENGLLKPTEPLNLQEGQRVQLTVHPIPLLEPLHPRTPEEADYVRRIKEVHTIEELHAVMLTAPPLPEGYDLIEALNANRRASGERPLFPTTSPEEAR